jgi:hypothetical protein
MTDTEYVLLQLANHPHGGRDAMQIISASIRDRGVGLTVHSRVADLRRDGWDVTCAVEGKTRKNRDRYVYRLRGRASQEARPSVEREQRGVVEPPTAAPLDAHNPDQLELIA